MAQLFVIHPVTPQARLVERAADMVRKGALIAYPTDSCYALGCHLGDKAAVERIRARRQFDARHPLTLVCSDLSQIAQYAQVGNRDFRLLKAATPGSFTFILPASREVPRRLQHGKRSTIGLRIPNHPVAHALLEALGEPLLSTTLLLPGIEDPLNDANEIAELLDGRVDLVIDGGACGLMPTTVVDMTGDVPEVVRSGAGPLARERDGAPAAVDRPAGLAPRAPRVVDSTGAIRSARRGRRG
jgi:tRNA threonylcarbamoyl adenosine modification protein (Sua5/YciO/YrdC/YwlC family)